MFTLADWGEKEEGRRGEAEATERGGAAAETHRGRQSEDSEGTGRREEEAPWEGRTGGATWTYLVQDVLLLLLLRASVNLWFQRLSHLS